jgi:glycosyltransferase involved in cell wall biosynthesis
VLRRYTITTNDTIFFPSADYYGAITLLDQLMRQPLRRPKIHMRMIGVTENVAVRNLTSRADLLRRVQEAREAGIDVCLSAETPVYATYLSRVLKGDVFYFPYPLMGPLIPMPRVRPALVTSIGQGRDDKGYFLLADLIRFTGFQKRAELTFAIQSIPGDHPDFCARYERVLEAIPNVKLLPPVLKDEEVADLYHHAAVILLPYNKKSYAMRGSAIYQEATAFGRPVIGLSDVGFADLIERYQNGYICHDLKECADAIYKCLATSPEEWEQRMQESRRLYAADLEVAMHLFLGKAS